jgi:hypothetical protein
MMGMMHACSQPVREACMTTVTDRTLCFIIKALGCCTG